MNTQIKLEKIIKDFENYKVATDAHSIVAITDTKGVITHVNEKFCQISQYSYHELVGSTHKIINSGYHPRSFFKSMWKSIANGEVWNGEICNQAKDGSLYWVDTTIVPLKDSQGILQNYISIRTDITRLKNSEDHARHMALHDELTGLPNRYFMRNRMQEMTVLSKVNNSHSSLMMLDLDNFKNINDTLGHDYGDQLLKLVASRIQICITEKISIVRLGGDEFLLMLSDLSSDEEEAYAQVMAIAQKVRNVFSLPFILKKQEIYTSSSIGVFIFKDINLPKNELLKYADMALYKAKESGRNCICVFDPQLEQIILAKTTLLSELRLALIRNELELYYQKIVDIDQKIIGYEALLRWHHPTQGLVFPGQFIEEVEKSDLIHEIGHHVLVLACKQLKEWEHNIETADWTISINISAQQFRQIDFDTKIINVVVESEINPKLLRLELTESMFYDDMHHAIEKMKKVMEKGLRFSMDDFGVGYSSLNYLKNLPLDQLKIDRSFVQDIVENPRDLAIIKTIVDLANILNLDVVVEGVETQQQFELLQHNGCKFFQGYYFGKPRPISLISV